MPLVYRLRGVLKSRTAEGAGFRLLVPELNIAKGEKIVLVGQSGCGKSTLLDLLAMVLRPDSGDAFHFSHGADKDADVLALWQRRRLDRLSELRKRHIGYVLQTGGLLPYLNVRDNIALSRRLLGLPEDETVRWLAEGLGINSHLNKLPGLLSAGERQRVAIARALAHTPTVVIADEPTSSLDPITGRRIMAMFMGLVNDLGLTVIVASHDWARVDKLGLRKLQHRTRQRDGGAVTESEFMD